MVVHKNMKPKIQNQKKNNIISESTTYKKTFNKKFKKK